LNNAAKYTKPEGRISLAIIKKPDATVEVSVQDTGIGIKPQDVNKIFELFIQFSKPFVETQGDIGIGLKIIKDIVKLHGGTITVKSDGINRGSRFTVSLPTIPPPLKTGTERSKKKLSIIKRKILVVDDNKDISTSLEHLLTRLGHEVAVANDGTGALSTAKDFKPEVILLDIGLPDMTGYEVARRLRKIQGDTTKIIALSGYGQEKDKLLSKESGFDYHMTKPVSIGEIDKIIKKCFHQ
jgi:CheY-like chemotaxis protein